MREKLKKLNEEKNYLQDLAESLKLVDYWRRRFYNKCKECEDLECDKEELEFHIEVLEEKIKRIEDDRDENYRPIPMSEQLDISDRDFL